VGRSWRGFGDRRRCIENTDLLRGRIGRRMIRVRRGRGIGMTRTWSRVRRGQVRFLPAPLRHGELERRVGGSKILSTCCIHTFWTRCTLHSDSDIHQRGSFNQSQDLQSCPTTRPPRRALPHTGSEPAILIPEPSPPEPRARDVNIVYSYTRLDQWLGRYRAP
jgi:hypothetical protein